MTGMRWRKAAGMRHVRHISDKRFMAPFQYMRSLGCGMRKQ